MILDVIFYATVNKGTETFFERINICLKQITNVLAAAVTVI